MSDCYCNKLKDNKMKYDYIYNIKSVAPASKIPNKCLHDPEIDERRMDKFIKCIETTYMDDCNKIKK
jgi:hypothetical protein